MKNIILILLLSSFCINGFSQAIENQEQNQLKSTVKEETTKYKVYPNPCRLDKVTIESGKNDITEISITNIAGKQIFKKRYESAEMKSEIELSEVPNGIYVIKIKTEDNKTVAKKLIVSKDQ